MSATVPAQQSRTPRASRHKYSKSAVLASDSESHTQQPQANNRQNKARNAPAPAWQDNDSLRPAEGYFNDQGEFVMAPGNDAQFAGTSGYGSPAEGVVNASAAKRPAKKQPRAKNGPPRQNGNQSPQPPPQQQQQQQQQQYQQYHQQFQQQYQHQSTAPSFAPPNMTPVKPGAAYAGPTWNASPAASKLPVPKFFSKSMPPETSQPSLQARLDQESDKSDSAESPPTSDAIPDIPTPPRNEDSPLDFLFKKDKEQKAKRQSAGPGAFASTPTRPPVGGMFSTEPPRPGDWNSIYGSGARHHNRHASNGSNKEFFMMELDGNNTSPQAHKVSPQPALAERMSSVRSVTAPSAMPQSIPAPYHNSPHHGQSMMYASPMHGNSMPSLVPSPGQAHPGARLPDSSASPFYRGSPQQQPPRSADSTPLPKQTAAYYQNLHYGNRNLSPLFQAAKQDPNRPSSNLRQEIHASPKVAELPDNANHFAPSGNNGVGHHQQPMNPDQVAKAYLLSQNPPATALPKFLFSPQQFPSAQPPRESTELDGQSRPRSDNGPSPNPAFVPAAPPHNPNRSVEDQLKRMLKMSLNGSSFEQPGVR